MQCTNPACETWINVPDGAKQVICPNCNTWHFPSAFEESSNSNSSSNSSDYGIPPVANESFAGDDLAVAPKEYINDDVEEVTSAVVNINDNLESDDHVGYLITTTGDRLGLKVGKNVIGRKDCDLVISDRKVSRRHCVVEVSRTDNGLFDFTIYDIGHLDGTSSTNGVFVSGRSQRLQDYERIPLRNGASIHIGDVHLNLKSSLRVG